MTLNQKTKKTLTWTGLSIILLIIFIPKIMTGINNIAKEPEKVTKQKIQSVDVLIMTGRRMQNKVFANGALMSNEEIELKSEISGKITEIHFEEGAQVKKGQLLVKINDSDLQATLKKNKAKETLAEDKEFRYRQLLEKNLTSQSEYDVAKEELNSVKADVEYEEALIAKTEIRAPFDGIIGLRSVSPGSYISPDAVIASLQSINPIKVDFSVPQKYYGILKVGKSLVVKITSTGKEYQGKIYAVEPKIDPSTRTVKARAYIPNEKSELAPGAYVEINIIIEDIPDALLIPSGAVVPDISGEKVFLYKNGNAVSQNVVTGMRTEKDIQIISGIEKGDTLITSGIIQLRPGMPVEIKQVN